jgi:hypothetical protein
LVVLLSYGDGKGEEEEVEVKKMPL